MKTLARTLLAVAVFSNVSVARAAVPGAALDGLVRAAAQEPAAVCVPTTTSPGFDELCLRYADSGMVQVRLYRRAGAPVRMAVSVVSGVNESRVFVDWANGTPSADGGLVVYELYPSDAACRAVASDCEATPDGRYLGRQIAGLLTPEQIAGTVQQALDAITAADVVPQ